MSEPTIRYASVCSGVEAASLAWEKLDWKPVWFSEVEPFPCKVLAERFGASSPINPLDPADASDEKDRKERVNWLKAIRREKMPSVDEAKVPNLGDMSKINGKEYHGTIDLLVGGTPCQGLSIAGNQKGFDDPRSALALKYVELLGSARPRWFVWENVPNAFSCNGGGDVKEFFRQITEIGYGVCWRVLDAEYVRVDGFPGAVPQRRRRIFAVGYLGDWRPAAKVLFESKMLCGDSAPRRLKGKATPGDTEKRTGESNALDANAGTADAVRNTVETGKGFYRESDVGGTLEAHEDQHRRNIICIENGQSAAASAVNKSTTLSCDHEAPIIVFHGSQDPIHNPDHANAVNRNQGLENCVCFEPGILKREEDGGDSRISKDVCGTIRANMGDNIPAVCLSQYGDVAGSLTARHDSSPCADRGMNIIACNTQKQAMNCDDDVIGCVSATDYKEPQIICYENHAQDSRIKECGDVAPTVSAKAGTGGNNTPIVAFALDPLASNSMRSKNPNSGFHEIDVAKTLDTSEQNPCKNQGGMVVLSIAENVIDRTGNSGANGVGVKDDVSYTLNTAGTPGVCVPLDMRNATRDPEKRDETNRQGVGVGEDGDPMNTLSTVHVPGVAYGFMGGQGAKAGGIGFGENFSPTLRSASGGNSMPSVLLKNIGWIVRRITPLEAERLMGFPDCHTMIPWNGKAAAECPDAPRYKACGNSMCVNAMRWLGERIDAVEKSIQAGTFDQLFDADDLEIEGDETEMDEDAEAEYMVILEDQAKEILRLKQENEQLRQTVAAYQQKENAK